MLQQPAYPQLQKFSFLIKVAVFGLGALYLLNCVSPLRLHVDSLRYFAILDCIQLGCPPDSAAAQDYLPYGYTALLLALSKIGLLKSFVIVLINCIYLFAGLYFARKIFGNTIHPMFFALLVLLNWTTIKFVTHPLSEMQYVFFSIASIYFFYRYTQTKKLLSLFLSFAFGGIAFITRSVGIALAAALVTGLIWQYKKELISLIRKNKIFAVIVLLICIGVIVFAKQLGLDHYTHVFTKQFAEGVGFADLMKWHFTEWAEITYNTSMDKLARYMPGSSAKIFFILSGVLIFAAFVYFLFFRKNNIPFIVKAYLFFYCVLMFNWPFYDPRFWVPIIPFIAVIVSQVPFARMKGLKWIMPLFFVVYGLLGLVSSGYITYTSVKKETMARTQANGVYRNEYETLFFGKPQSDTAKHVDPVILNVLQRFD